MTTADRFVAVVDDESSVRTALRRLLRLADFDVVLFESGDAFLQALEMQKPACVVLDLNMIGLSGIEVLQRMRSLRLGIPVICITASDEVALDELVRHAGASFLLRKPFPSTDLIAAVTAVLR